MEYPLNVPAPRSFAYVKRNIPQVTVEQRERALKSTHYNEFAFPAGMLTVDMLSDSGTTAMTDLQWSALMLGDESYGRNKGYYVLLDAMRDVFERGDDQKRSIDLIRTGCEDIEKLMDELYLVECEGGRSRGPVRFHSVPAFVLATGNRQDPSGPAAGDPTNYTNCLCGLEPTSATNPPHKLLQSNRR